jgi:DNA-binding NtrC family response regulator
MAFSDEVMRRLAVASWPGNVRQLRNEVMRLTACARNSVITEDDLWEIKDRITAAGIWISEVIDHGFIHSIYTYDPNGIPIEFSRVISERDIRIMPVMADRAPSETGWEGPEPQPGKWPPVTAPTPKHERKVYPGAGSELFHGKKA